MTLSKDKVSEIVNSFLAKKAETDAWDAKMIQLADFTFDLFEKQHAKYSHLRPMYRTVHRKTPRRIVFRAIRWVNPARMFPKAMLTREEIANLSPEERAEAIAEIASYRREAHLIRNRYNEMISLIKEGNLPYYIKYAGVKVQTMDQYLERAERLKDGTDEWEFELDKKAVEFREEMNKKGEKFEDVDALWQDGLPPFYDPKRGRKKKAPMRKLDREGNKIEQMDVRVGEFLVVPEAEIRKGEELWIPKKVREGIALRIPSNFADHHFPNARNFLENEGQFQTELPNGNKVNIIYDISAEGVARREGRATQMDPLREQGGRWGRPRHAGGQAGEPGSHMDAPGLGGDSEAHDEVDLPDPQDVARKRRAGAQQVMSLKDPAAVKKREEEVRKRREARAAQAKIEKDKLIAEMDKWPKDKGMPTATPAKPQGFAGGKGKQDKNVVNVVKNNEDKQNGADQLLKDLGKEGDDLWLYGEQDLENIDPSEVEFVKKMGGGVNTEYNFKVKIRGKHYIYKLPPGEQLGEKAAYAFDKALGLGVMPHIKIANFGLEPFKKSVADGTLDVGDLERIERAGNNGGGFLQEWHPGLNSGADFSEIDNRHKLYGLIALDSMLGNSDRHGGNWGNNSKGELVAFDNGQLGRFNDIKVPNMRQDGMVKWEIHRDRDGAAWTTSNKLSAGWFPNDNGMGRRETRAEFNAWFDEHFDMNQVLDIAQAMNMPVIGTLMDGTKVTTEVIRERMGDSLLYATHNEKPSWYTQTGSVKLNDPPPSREGGVPDDGSDTASASPQVGQQPRMPGLTVASEDTPEDLAGAQQVAVNSRGEITEDSDSGIDRNWGAGTRENVAMARNAFNEQASGAPASMRQEMAEQFISDYANDLPSNIRVSDFAASMDGRVIRKMYE